MPTTQVGSHTVYYDEIGAGHPLILLMGFGRPRLFWWKQLEPFAKKFRVINMDNRDAGDSAPGKGPYTITDMAADVAGVIKNLNLGRTHIVGFSMGGMIAQEVAIRYTGLADRLVLVATSAGGPTYVKPRPEVSALLIRDETEDYETYLRRVFPQIMGEGYIMNHPEDMDQIVKHDLAKPMSLESRKRQFGSAMAFLSQGVADRLAEITAPTFVIHGDYDPLIPYPNGEYLATNIKGARLSTYAGVGHMVMIESPDRFNREVIEFLK